MHGNCKSSCIPLMIHRDPGKQVGDGRGWVLRQKWNTVAHLNKRMNKYMKAESMESPTRSCFGHGASNPRVNPGYEGDQESKGKKKSNWPQRHSRRPPPPIISDEEGFKACRFCIRGWRRSRL
eukprot:1162151-Pelagomonas_calceolata.AAC.8